MGYNGPQIRKLFSLKAVCIIINTLINPLKYVAPHMFIL